MVCVYIVGLTADYHRANANISFDSYKLRLMHYKSIIMCQRSEKHVTT